MRIVASAFAGGIWFALSFAAPPSIPAAGQPATEAIELEGNDISDAIQQLANAIRQPIGWVVASDDVKPCPVAKAKVGNANLSEALNWITAQCPEYTWTRDRLGIVIHPVQQTKSIIDLPIGNFVLTNVKAYDAEDAVRKLPEVRQWLRANGVRPYDVESGTKWIGTTTTFSINLHEVPLREVLNEIARKSGRMTWRIAWHGHDTYLGIDL